MENNKSYLQKLPLLALILFASTAIQVFFLITPIGESHRATQLIHAICRGLLTDSVFLISLGIALNKWRQAIISLIASCVVVAIRGLIYYYAANNMEYAALVKNYIILELLNIVPYIIFFIAGKHSVDKILKIFLAIMVFRGVSVIFYAPQGIQKLSEFFVDDDLKYDRYLSLISFTVLRVFALILYCELQNFASSKEMKWKLRILNPGNDYPKGGSTILFFVLKMGLVALVIGQGALLKQLQHSSYRNDIFSNYYFYSSLLNTLFLMPVIVFYAWYLRKFLLEYFATYNLRSKFIYWLLLLPVIGFIVWLILLVNKKNNTFAEKVSSIHNFASASSQGITAIVIAALSIQMLAAMINTNAAGMLSVVFSALLFAWFTNQRSGYYFNLYLNFAVLLLFFLYIFGWQGRSSTDLSVLYSFVLFNGTQLFLLYPIYHYDDFAYIDDGESVNNEEGILTEFENQ